MDDYVHSLVGGFQDPQYDEVEEDEQQLEEQQLEEQQQNDNSDNHLIDQRHIALQPPADQPLVSEDEDEEFTVIDGIDDFNIRFGNSWELLDEKPKNDQLSLPFATCTAISTSLSHQLTELPQIDTEQLRNLAGAVDSSEIPSMLTITTVIRYVGRQSGVLFQLDIRKSNGRSNIW